MITTFGFNIFILKPVVFTLYFLYVRGAVTYLKEVENRNEISGNRIHKELENVRFNGIY